MCCGRNFADAVQLEHETFPFSALPTNVPHCIIEVKHLRKALRRSIRARTRVPGSARRSAAIGLKSSLELGISRGQRETSFLPGKLPPPAAARRFSLRCGSAQHGRRLRHRDRPVRPRLIYWLAISAVSTLALQRLHRLLQTRFYAVPDPWLRVFGWAILTLPLYRSTRSPPCMSSLQADTPFRPERLSASSELRNGFVKRAISGAMPSASA